MFGMQDQRLRKQLLQRASDNQYASPSMRRLVSSSRGDRKRLKDMGGDDETHLMKNKPEHQKTSTTRKDRERQNQDSPWIMGSCIQRRVKHCPASGEEFMNCGWLKHNAQNANRKLNQYKMSIPCRKVQRTTKTLLTVATDYTGGCQHTAGYSFSEGGFFTKTVLGKNPVTSEIETGATYHVV